VKIWQKAIKMTVGTFHRQQQPTSQHQQQQQQYFMAQRSLAMNFYAANPNQMTTDTKGLLNGPGQNNCFLNCAVQVSQESTPCGINFKPIVCGVLTVQEQ
jgi:hypothetical protein